MSLSGVVDVPGEQLLTPLVLVIGVLAGLLMALVARLSLVRRRRAARRLRALVDPVTGLRSRVRLQRDLRVLFRDGHAAGTHLLVTLELPHLLAHELEHGVAAADELLRRLARRLANAVGRAGGVYALERGRFGVLARVGRLPEGVIVQAATAALSDEREGVGIAPRTASLRVSLGDADPRSALQRLEELEDSGLQEPRVLSAQEPGDSSGQEPGVLSGQEPGVSSAQGVSEVGFSRAGSSAGAERQAGAAVSRQGRGSAGPVLLERGRPARVPRRPSHNGRPPGSGGPAAGSRGPAAGSRGPAAGSEGPARGIPDAPEAPDALAAARRRDAPRSNPPPRWMPYLRVSTRFRLSVLCGVLWMSLSAWLAWPWIEQLASSISLTAALVLIAGIALIPGYLNVQLVSSLLMDHPAPIDFDFDYPALTLLVAAYNEECDIAQTLAYALAQEYPAPLHVFVIDDGSRDETVGIARSFAHLDARVRVLEVPHGGKAAALNAGLRAAETPLVPPSTPTPC